MLMTHLRKLVFGRLSRRARDPFGRKLRIFGHTHHSATAAAEIVSFAMRRRQTEALTTPGPGVMKPRKEIARRVAMKSLMNAARLRSENAALAGTGGVSRGNAGFGFRPAFLDFSTLTIYPSRFADGRPAPFHLLDGLPDEVVADRSVTGRVVAAKATIVSGFERGGFFYTRQAAARACAEWVSWVDAR
jgi:hypothetical protein